MSTRYLVLRTDDPLAAAFDPLGPLPFTQIGTASLSVSVVDGRELDGGQLRADPQNVAVMDADAILSLVTPLASAAATDQDLDRLVPSRNGVRVTDGVSAVGADQSPFDGTGVRVAILDTGLDVGHPAFKGKTLVTHDFTASGQGPEDVTDANGHGTHCAGTICGADVDGVRFGVARGVSELSVAKVLGPAGGKLEWLLKALLWAVLDRRATVVSMSLGFDLPGNTARLIGRGVDARLAAQAALQIHGDIVRGVTTLRAFLETQSPDLVVLAASGNESDRANGFSLAAAVPAAELLAVGALRRDGNGFRVAPFSNGRVRVVAPGVDVVSAATGGGLSIKSGTSMATPHVAGVAALWAQRRAAGAAGDVRSSLLRSATRQPLLDQDVDAIGEGLVQAPVD